LQKQLHFLENSFNVFNFKVFVTDTISTPYKHTQCAHANA